MSEWTYEHEFLEEVIRDDAKRQTLREKIVDRIMNNLINEATQIAAEEELSEVDGPAGLVFVLGQIKDALEAGIQWKIADAVYEEIPLKALTQALGYAGSSTTLRRRYPQINELVKTRTRIEILQEGENVGVGDWAFDLEPLKPFVPKENDDSK